MPSFDSMYPLRYNSKKSICLFGQAGYYLGEMPVEPQSYEKSYESIPTLTPTIQYSMGMLYRDGVIYDPPEPDCLQAAYYFRGFYDAKIMMEKIKALKGWK